MSSLSETTSLLVREFRDVGVDGPQTVNAGYCARVGCFFDEFLVLARYSLPVFGSQLLEFSFLTVSILSIGHTSATALSAVSLGTLTANVTAFTLMQGFTAALDTMLPPAWTSQPHLVGLWCQRMIVLMCLLMIPIYGLWFQMEAIFLSLKQEPEVAHLSTQYLRWLSLGLPAYAFNCVSRRYFQCQGHFSVPTLIISIVMPINIILNYVLVWGPPRVRLGFIGAPIATAISFNLVSILSIAYGVFYLPHTAWSPPSMRMFSNLRILVVLGAGGAGQMASEWCAFEIVAIAASRFGPVTLASQSVLVTFLSMFFQIYLALSIVTSVRLGNLLGEGNSVGAQVTTHTCLIMTVALCGVINLVMFVFRQYWAYMFTQEPDVVKLVTSLISLVGLFQTFDAIIAVASGVLRARGKQIIAALLRLSADYAVGLPLGIYLAFQWDFQLRGLWMGLTTGLACGALTGVSICLRTDWQQEVWRTMIRLKENNNPNTPSGGESLVQGIDV